MIKRREYCWRWTASAAKDIRRGYSFVGDDRLPLPGLSGFQDLERAIEYGRRFSRRERGQKLVAFRVARFVGRGDENEDLFVPLGYYRAWPRIAA